ncbi:SDR family NAD(P)-dependent oxidoreductase [Salinibacterium sp. dk5596]|uniref:SDR family NAD(P)-dependent oxidoreductase n=1 Tax=unclassified Salinibacterium TaxID=2632331 RepID=UPI00351A15A5
MVQAQTAIISGAASGIGQATAVRLARRGVAIVAGYYPGDPHDVEETCKQVREVGGSIVAVPVDVRSREECDALAATAVEHFGRIDIAVAAAGIVRISPIEEMSDGDWDNVLSVDLGGVMRVFRATVERMEGPGALVAVSSVTGGIYGWDDHSHYASAKAGVIGLSRSLAVELSPRRIRVNVVLPGLIETPQTMDGVNSMGAENLAKAHDVIPLSRIGAAEEVAGAIDFLASDAASYITGQQLVVDGGLSARRPHTFPSST